MSELPLQVRTRDFRSEVAVPLGPECDSNRVISRNSVKYLIIRRDGLKVYECSHVV